MFLKITIELGGLKLVVRAKLSNTQVRIQIPDQDLDLQNRRLPSPIVPPKLENILTALYYLAQPIANQINWSTVDAPWKPLLEHSGFTPHLATHLKAVWIENEKEAFRHLNLRFTKKELVTSGVLNSKDDFLFFKHRLLFPVFEKNKVVNLIGVKPSSGFSEIVAPGWINPYLIKGQRTRQNNLFLTFNLVTTFRLGQLGYSCFYLPNPDVIRQIKPSALNHLQLTYCDESTELTPGRIEHIKECLSTHNLELNWKSLGQVETDWLLIESRHERAALCTVEPKNKSLISRLWSTIKSNSKKR